MDKVLFIEDDKFDQIAITRYAGSHDLGFNYSFAGSVKEATDVLSTQKFDAVVVDFLLGDGNAFDLFNQLQDTPFIIVTGTGDEAVAVKAMKAGACDYIIKTPDGNHLQTLPITIENAVKRKRSELELEQYRKNLEELVQLRTRELTLEIEERKKTEIILKNQNVEIATLNQKYFTINEELKRSNDDLKKAKEKAEESDRLKTAFLANMSHEIRTPMNSIIGFSGLLEEEELSQAQRENYISIINTNAQQLLVIISDIIDISKIESKQINLNLKKCDINKMFSNLLDEIYAEKENKNKTKVELIVKCELTDDQSLIIADEFRLRQILTNLLSNALKFTEQGNIEFGYRIDSPASITFFVKDTGIGIAQVHQQIIFDRFRQIDSTYTRKYGGTGLGLAISRGLVELLDGKIWVESEKDKGSIFYFTLPYNPCLPESIFEHTKDNSNAFKKYLWQNKTILLIDDLEVIYHFFVEVLQDTGVKIIYAKNGRDGLYAVKENSKIDLILLDILLPDINGYEVAKKIKNFKKSIPIIAQTAYALAGDKEKSLQAGCDEYVSKPIDTIKLLEIIEKYFLNKSSL